MSKWGGEAWVSGDSGNGRSQEKEAKMFKTLKEKWLRNDGKIKFLPVFKMTVLHLKLIWVEEKFC